MSKNNNVITGEPIAWCVTMIPAGVKPSNRMEADVLDFQYMIFLTRQNFGTPEFWPCYRRAISLWRKWWYTGLGLATEATMRSLRRTHFKSLYEPSNSKVSQTFWKAFDEIETLIYPNKGGKSDLEAAKTKIGELRKMFDDHKAASGREICSPDILTTLVDLRNREAKRSKRKAQLAARAEMAKNAVPQPAKGVHGADKVSTFRRSDVLGAAKVA